MKKVLLSITALLTLFSCQKDNVSEEINSASETKVASIGEVKKIDQKEYFYFPSKEEVVVIINKFSEDYKVLSENPNIEELKSDPFSIKKMVWTYEAYINLKYGERFPLKDEIYKKQNLKLSIKEGEISALEIQKKFLTINQFIKNEVLSIEGRKMGLTDVELISISEEEIEIALNYVMAKSINFNTLAPDLLPITQYTAALGDHPIHPFPTNFDCTPASTTPILYKKIKENIHRCISLKYPQSNTHKNVYANGLFVGPVGGSEIKGTGTPSGPKYWHELDLIWGGVKNECVSPTRGDKYQNWAWDYYTSLLWPHTINGAKQIPTGIRTTGGGSLSGVYIDPVKGKIYPLSHVYKYFSNWVWDIPNGQLTICC